MIYILEDDPNIRELVTYTLNSSGLEASGYEKPSDFYEALKKRLPDLIILDIMLPQEDGISILKKLRHSSHTQMIPVLMLTAKSSEYDKVVGLDSGADDYLSKPFGMMELVARIKALLRRSSSRKNETELSFKNLVLSSEYHYVKVNGESISLTSKEFELLYLLMKYPGKVFTRDELLDRIWGYEFDGESRTVDVHVRSLRVKLKECGEYIETIRGFGYKLGERADDKSNL